MRNGVRRALRWTGLPTALVAATVLLGAFLFADVRGICEELPEPALRCAIDIEAPVAEVWEAWTRTEEPARYYFDAVLQGELEEGASWRFITDDRKRLLARGSVVEAQAPRRLVLTFEAADLPDAPSRISVDMAPANGGTRFVLVHDRFGGRTATYRRFRRAHPLVLAGLAAIVETGELPLRARLYTWIFKPGMKLATVRAEPWPESPRAD